MNKRTIYVPILLLLLLLSGCAAQNSLYKNTKYRDLLMYSGAPKEVFGHWSNGVFVQFQWFKSSYGEDTVVVVKFDGDGRFEFVGGIGIEEEFVRHKFMDIVEIDGNSFFTLNYSNIGNSNNNIVRMFYIAPEDCSLHPVEVVRADSLYSATPSDGRFIWDGEQIDFTRQPITSRLYIWEKDDCHAKPTAGRVDVVYKMVRTANRKYRFYPNEMNLLTEVFDTDDSSDKQTPLLRHPFAVEFILKYCRFRDGNPTHQEEADIINGLMRDIITNQDKAAEQKEQQKANALEILYDNSAIADEDSSDTYRMAIRRYLCFIALALQSDKYRYKTFLNDARNCIIELNREEESAEQFAVLDMLDVLIMTNFSYSFREMERQVKKLQTSVAALKESEHARPGFVEEYKRIVELIIENKNINLAE